MYDILIVLGFILLPIIIAGMLCETHHDREIHDLREYYNADIDAELAKLTAEREYHDSKRAL